MKRQIKFATTLSLVGMMSLMAIQGFADTSMSSTTKTTTMTQQSTLPQYIEDGEWVSLSGKVQQPMADHFTLNYGRGTIRVDLDMFDTSVLPDNQLKAGQNVTVTGHMDNNLFSKREIDASALYVYNTRKHYFSADETDRPDAVVLGYMNEHQPRVNAMMQGHGQTHGQAKVKTNSQAYGNAYQATQHTNIRTSSKLNQEDGSWINTTGKIVSIDDDEITLQTSYGDIDVDMDEMGYNPNDDDGYKQLKVGQRVLVTGVMDNGLFEEREIVARNVVRLSSRK